MTRLVAREVSAGYGRVEILHGVSVEAGDGEVTCIFGPNGCGKSTLLGAISGVVDVWAGDVQLDGKRLSGQPAHAILRRGLALMPQGGGVFPQLSVRDNLRIGGYTLGSRRELERRIEELLEEFPRLRERLPILAGNLSGGEQMMLAITRALIVRPRFILFDEPSAGLSPKLAQEALARVAGLAKRGVGVLIVEQNIREALRVADRIYVLVGGRNRFAGRPGDIASGQQLMELYLGAPTKSDEQQMEGDTHV
ncbi:MAG: ABC transporter ATP-binding protein [Acetobacteraceae bacterium]